MNEIGIVFICVGILGVFIGVPTLLLCCNSKTIPSIQSIPSIPYMIFSKKNNGNYIEI